MAGKNAGMLRVPGGVLGRGWIAGLSGCAVLMLGHALWGQTQMQLPLDLTPEQQQQQILLGQQNQTSPMVTVPMMTLDGTQTTGLIGQDSTQIPGGLGAYTPQNGQQRGPGNANGSNGQPIVRRLSPPSEFERMVQATTGRVLPIFGAELFQRIPSTFAPLNQVPVPADYTIGPGDEINLQVWGQNRLEGRYRVDRTGSLPLPGVGSVRVAGMTMADLQPYLKSQYDRLYKDVHLSATVGQLRAIQVFVVGYAVAPGSYTIGSLSTLVDALFVSGGPLPNGSMRDIQLKRGSETVVHFDLYDFLLHGDKSKSVPLQPGDTIFIPAVGPQVAILGSVNAPAIYELRQQTTVPEALQLAGGETNTASGATVRLERIFEHSVRSMEDVSLATNPAVTLQNGDMLTVTPVIDHFRNAVTLIGNVANPARYAWHAGMRVSDLIPNKEALITRQYFERVNRLGQMPQPNGLPVRNGLPGGTQGASPQGNSFQGATGSQAAAGAPNASQSNQATGEGGTQTAAMNSANNGPQRGAPSASVATSLTENASGFPAQNQVKLSAPDIDWSYAVIERKNATDLQTSLIPFNLGALVLNGDQSQNLELQPGDVVRIFSTADIPVPTAQRARFVQLGGEFASPGWYSVLPGETLRHLIQRAGGLTSDAYLYGSEFSRESTRRLQEQRLQQIADDLERQTSARLAQLASSALPSAQAAMAASAEDARGTVARLRQATPNGRVALGLNPDSNGLDSIPDMALEDGDRFIVPHMPDNVSVEGEVYNASAFLYRPKMRMRDYLKQAGGPDREADRSRMFVLRADGSVVSSQYDRRLDKASIYAGDTIVVPPAVDRRSIFRNVLDFTTVLSGMGVPLATLYLLARQ